MMDIISSKLMYINETKEQLRVAINSVLNNRSEPLLTKTDLFEDYPSVLYTDSPQPSLGSLNGTISDKLLRLNETKTRLREAINSELGTEQLTVSDALRDYVDAINLIT